jgi:hypothetical protein
MATEVDLGQVDLSSLVDLMIAGEADEREAGAFAVAEFVAESDSHQVFFLCKNLELGKVYSF